MNFDVKVLDLKVPHGDTDRYIFDSLLVQDQTPTEYFEKRGTSFI